MATSTPVGPRRLPKTEVAEPEPEPEPDELRAEDVTTTLCAHVVFSVGGHQCLGPLSAAEAKKRWEYYILRHHEGRFVGYEKVGEPATTESPGMACTRWDYDIQPDVTRATCYDSHNRVRTRARISSNEHESQYVRLDAWHRPLPLRDSQASVLRWGLDQMGRVQSIAYFDQAGKPMLNGNRVHQIREELDVSGAAVVTSYFYPGGRPMRDKSGVHAIARTFDARGDMVREEFINSMGRNVLSSDGFHAQEVTRDDVGNPTAVRFPGLDNEPVGATQYGAAGLSMTYDARGKRVTRVFLDASGAPTLGVRGHAGERVRYDDEGRAVEITFLGSDGLPHAASHGVAGSHLGYDPLDQLAEIVMVGLDGSPLSPMPTVRYTRDARGNVLLEEHFALDVRPRANPYSCKATDYNEFA